MFYMVLDFGDLRGCEEFHFTATLHRFEDSLNDLTTQSTHLTEVYKDMRPYCSHYYQNCLFVSAQIEIFASV